MTAMRTSRPNPARAGGGAPSAGRGSEAAPARPGAKKASRPGAKKASRPGAKKASRPGAKKAAGKRRGGPLTRADRVFLRGLGHLLDPVIQVGHKGLTDTLLAETRRALDAHELIKVKLGKNAPDEVDLAAARLSAETQSELVQVIGGVLLLYREPADPDDRRIHIPGR